MFSCRSLKNRNNLQLMCSRAQSSNFGLSIVVPIRRKAIGRVKFRAWNFFLDSTRFITKNRFPTISSRDSHFIVLTAFFDLSLGYRLNATRFRLINSGDQMNMQLFAAIVCETKAFRGSVNFYSSFLVRRCRRRRSRSMNQRRTSAASASSAIGSKCNAKVLISIRDGKKLQSKKALAKWREIERSEKRHDGGEEKWQETTEQ